MAIVDAEVKITDKAAEDMLKKSKAELDNYVNSIATACGYDPINYGMFSQRIEYDDNQYYVRWSHYDKK